jgi:oligopeptide/dipeptide ABC transporter ATP-binding protein
MLTPRSDPILDISGLSLSITTDDGIARVIDNADLRIPRGKIVGVVGESGCGKSTLVRAILGILPRAAKIDAGSMRFDGRDLLGPDREKVLRQVRGTDIGFIPQDPLQALNPVFKIGTQLIEVLRSRPPAAGRANTAASDARRNPRERLIEMLRLVQIPEPEAILDRYPHQVSGGQRQRLLIASALMLNPSLVIADEPTTSLDVTTQREILRLLKDFTQRFGLSMLFITHDFGVVAQLCDRVTVMYAGQTVESATTRMLLDDPQHPYTRALLACHPARSSELVGIPGIVPSPLHAPSGCRYRTRCPAVMDRCATRPSVVALPGERSVACALYEPNPNSDTEVRSVAR